MAVSGINSVLSDAHITAILDQIAKKESTSTPGGPVNVNIGRSKDPGVIKAGHQNYGVINSIGFVGKYQIGYVGLADAGYVKIGPKKNSDLLNSANWLGVNGCGSLDDFLTNPAAQEDAARKLLQANYRYMRKYIGDCNTADVAGYCGAAHLVGWSDAIKLRQGIAKKDANGMSAQTYFDICRGAVCGNIIEPPQPPAGKDTAKVVTKEEKEKQKTEESAAAKKAEDVVGPVTVGQSTPRDIKDTQRYVEQTRQDAVKVPPAVAQKYATTGFIDPNLTYPKSSYKKFPDTNKLATHKDVRNTIVDKKNANRHRSIPTASGNSWEEPESPYNAKYPYNKVTETESGHVIEVDDTPGAERIHQYHMSGTYTETNENGSQVRRIVGDSYEIIDRNGNIFINGRCNLTVGGPAHILVLSDANLVVKGDTNITSENDVNWEVSGNFNLSVNGTMNTRVFGDVNTEIEEDQNTYVGGVRHEQVVGTVTTQYDSGETKQVSGTVTTNITESDIKIVGADVTQSAAGAINNKAGGAIVNNAGGKFDVKAGGNFDVNAAGSNLDGGQVHLNSGRAAAADIEAPQAPEMPSVIHANNRQPVGRTAYVDTSGPNMPYRSRTESVATTAGELNIDGGEQITNYAPGGTNITETGKNYTTNNQSATTAAGTVTSSDGTAVVSGDGTPIKSGSAATVPPVQTTDGWLIDPNQFLQMTVFPLTLQISKFFTLKDLVYNEGQNRLDKLSNGLSKGQVVYNLSCLAQKILDPIKYAYPRAAINSGLRIGDAGKSQHNRGQAADVRFIGMPLNEYEGVAKWIRDHLPFDQVILESARNVPTSLWVHVSYDSMKSAQRKQPMTMANGGTPGSPATKWDGIDITKLSWINTSFVKVG